MLDSGDRRHIQTPSALCGVDAYATVQQQMNKSADIAAITGKRL